MKNLARPLHSEVQSIFTLMKNKNLFLSLLATGLAAATFITLSTVVFPDSLRGDKLMAAISSIALILFAVRDYSCRPKYLRLKSAPLLRPMLRITIDARKPIHLPSDRTACIENNAA